MMSIECMATIKFSRTLNILSTVFVLCVQGFSVFADIRKYSANPENSQWNMQQTTRLQCQLTHDIPRFGQAIFTRYAGKEKLMEFELDMLRLPAGYSVAQVKSVPPMWKPGVSEKSLTQMKLLKQFDGTITDDAAWTLLSELEKGFMPTFYYQDFHSKFDQISVGISSVNFPIAYEQFLQCSDDLLPYSFEDIALTVLNYQSNSDQLTKASQERLRQLAEYLKHDPNIDEVSIDAFTDSYGGRSLNYELSKRRAEQVKAFLLAQGVDESRFTVTGFGEKRHIASNETELGRAKNRRVVIRMARSSI